MLTNLVGKMVNWLGGMLSCSYGISRYHAWKNWEDSGRLPCRVRERGACDTEQTCCVVGCTPLDIYGVREGLCGEGRLRGLARTVFGLLLLRGGSSERPLCGCRA